mgnify:CR=1 FL=1
MKTIELNSLGLSEMSTNEMKETNGGLLLVILAVCAVSLLVSSCVNSPVVITNEVNNTSGTAKSDSTLAR